MPHPGLSSADVRERQRRGLVNRVKSQQWRTYGGIVVRNLATWFNALVVPSAVVLFHLREYRGAIAVSGMMVVNTLIGLVQEIVAKLRLDRLTLVAATQVHLLRDGELKAISSDEVVQDDVLKLTVGEMIVADGQVLDANYLEVDEALLTGEADPVAKNTGDPLLAGSFCVAGEGLYQAIRVGPAVASQQIALEARQHRHAAGPIQLSIDRIVQWLSYVAIGLALLYLVQFWLHDFSETKLAQMVAATVTSMVPQGLVLTTTLVFTLGAIRLTRQGAVVQRLDAVEAMAAVDVLCLDKTGTLTTNKLRLARLLPLDPRVPAEDIRQRLRLFASASVDRSSKVLAALRDELGEAGVEKLDELPFKAKNRYSAVQVRDGAAERTLVLGAAEVLRPHVNAGDAGWERHWDGALESGHRLLLFAEALGAGKLGDLSSLPRLFPLALIGLEDEVRPEAVTALAALAEQGVAFKIISGDNPHTVRAVLNRLHLPIRDDEIISGDALAATGTRPDVVERCCVFGRVSPHQKLDIITTLQRRGHFVAMVGDGVNDILSIKRADLGMAMGAGSTATKTVAGLVLLNNDFSLLPAAMQEARIAVHNLRRAGKLFLTKNAYTIVIIAFALISAAVHFPYLPQQVTLLNTLTIGLPALVIAFGRTVGPTTDRGQFLREVGGFALFTGLALGLAGCVVLAISAYLRRDTAEAVQQTLLLAVLIVLSVQTTWRAVQRGQGRPSPNGRVLLGLSVAAVPAYLAAIYWAPSANFFQLQPVAPAAWAWVAAVCVPTMILVELGDRHLRRGPPARRGGAT